MITDRSGGSASYRISNRDDGNLMSALAFAGQLGEGGLGGGGGGCIELVTSDCVTGDASLDCAEVGANGLQVLTPSVN